MTDLNNVMQNINNDGKQITEDHWHINSAIDDFILEISALAESLPVIMASVGINKRSCSNKLDKFLEKLESKDKDGKKIYRIPIEQFNHFNRLENELKGANASMFIVPRHFVVSLISQYDAYLGNLYRILFKIKPDLIHTLEKDLKFCDILKYSDLTDLINSVIEKEVENLLRENHLEQLKILEKRITKISKKEFTLTSNLVNLPSFIEITERRNLFVHTNGIVTRQYLEMCKRHNVIDIENIKENDKLEAGPEYFCTAYNTIYEIGIKLGQVLWRKLFPEKLVEADENLLNITYELLLDGYYDLAKNILEFATEILPRNGNQNSRNALIINRALAYYLNNEPEYVDNILEKGDWSIGNHYKLAVTVIKENYEEAKDLMNKIGPKDDFIDKEAYQEWPLFKKFRDTNIFKETYKEIFSEDFLIRSTSEKAYIKLLKRVQDLKNKKMNKNDDQKV